MSSPDMEIITNEPARSHLLEITDWHAKKTPFEKHLDKPFGFSAF